MNRRRTGAVNYFQRDFKIRRQLAEIYNKSVEDFPSLREYNDYLEDIESIIYNLTHEIETQTQMVKIEKYKKENKDFISAKQSKKAIAPESITVTHFGSTGFSIQKFPNPVDMKQIKQFNEIVRQGYRTPQIQSREFTKEEIFAGGYGDFRPARCSMEAYCEIRPCP